MKPSSNFWPVGVVLTLVLFFAGTVGLVVMACSQRADLVSANYYEEEIGFQKQINRADRTARLEFKAAVSYDAVAKRLILSLPTGVADPAAQGQIQLYRPSEAALDQQVALHLNSNGAQAIDAAALKPGLWRVRVNWTAGGREFYLDQKVVVPSSDR
jgi:nitrogen fixation protein FixH